MVNAAYLSGLTHAIGANSIANVLCPSSANPFVSATCLSPEARTAASSREISSEERPKLPQMGRRGDLEEAEGVRATPPDVHTPRRHTPKRDARSATDAARISLRGKLF